MIAILHGTTHFYNNNHNLTKDGPHHSPATRLDSSNFMSLL